MKMKEVRRLKLEDEGPRRKKMCEDRRETIYERLKALRKCMYFRNININIK